MPVGPRNFFNKGIVMMLVLMGIVMFFVGLMILSGAGMVEPPSNSSDYDSYRDTIRNMTGAGRLVIEIGGLLACIGLICGGIVADDVSDKIRAVMVSAGIAIVISTLIVLGWFSPLTLL